MREPLAWIAAGTALGCWYWTDVSMAWVLVFTVLSSLVAMWRANRTSLFGLGVALGLFSGHLQPPAPPVQAHIVGRVQSVSGRTSIVETNAGSFWVQARDPLPQAGQWISARIQPTEPSTDLPGSWPHNHRLNIAGGTHVRATHWITSDDIRPQKTPTASVKNPGIIRAMTTGDRSQIPAATKELLLQTGTVHLLAISGLHVGIIAGFGYSIGWLLSRPLVGVGWAHIARLFPQLTALLCAAGYGTMIDWPVSSQRAIWMVGAASFASILGRKISAWQMLGMAAIAILFNDPSAIGSLGFLMSFGAVCGMVSWTPVLTASYHSSNIAVRWVTGSMAATIAATIGTLPVVALVFQHLALSAPVANLIAVPMFAAVSVPMALAGTVWELEWMLKIADLSISWTLSILKSLQWGVIHPAVDTTGAMLLVACIFLGRRPSWAIVCALVAFTNVNRQTDLQVTFPDIGQGSAALIEFTNGKKWLIDGGPPGKRVLHWLRRNGIHSLDAIIVSHPDIDHFGGLKPIIDHLDVDALWVSRKPLPEEREYHDLWRDAHQRGIEAEVIGPAPGIDDNEEGIVVRIQNGRHSFLFTGDIGADTENIISPHAPTVSVLQVPHHGSNRSSSPQFAAAAKPSWAVIQSGRNNSYGHPHPRVVAEWGTQKTLQTATLGTIRFHTNGETMTVHHWGPDMEWNPIQPSGF